VLTEVLLQQDPGGEFFERVLGMLMVRANLPRTHRIPRASAPSELRAGGEELAEAPVSSEEREEIQELLAKAKAHWKEYQRLKKR
jgi:hypothetical protein